MNDNKDCFTFHAATCMECHEAWISMAAGTLIFYEGDRMGIVPECKNVKRHGYKIYFGTDEDECLKAWYELPANTYIYLGTKQFAIVPDRSKHKSK